MPDTWSDLARYGLMPGLPVAVSEPTIAAINYDRSCFDEGDEEDCARAVAWVGGDESVMFGCWFGGAPPFSPNARAGASPVVSCGVPVSIAIVLSSLRSPAGYGALVIPERYRVGCWLVSTDAPFRVPSTPSRVLFLPSSIPRRPAHCAAPRHLPYSCPCACALYSCLAEQYPWLSCFRPPVPSASPLLCFGLSSR